MGYRNTLGVTLLLLTGPSFGWPNQLFMDLPVKKWVISKNSSLSVNGSTNVNKFSCVIPTCEQTDTLAFVQSKKDNGMALSGSIRLSISAFDCHNSGMTKQLRKTLNGQQYPELLIRFLSLNKMTLPGKKTGAITGFVEIEIAGVNKRFEVNYQIRQSDQKNMQLSGSRDVNFSDFNLVPPSKLGGMIKTKDLLNVEFQLNMTALD